MLLTNEHVPVAWNNATEEVKAKIKKDYPADIVTSLIDGERVIITKNVRPLIGLDMTQGKAIEVVIRPEFIKVVGVYKV